MMKKIQYLLLMICFISVLFGSQSTLFAQTSGSGESQIEDLHFKSAAGNWLERSDDYFCYVYKAADSAIVEEFLAVSQDVFETVTGYLQCLPPEKPTVILYGSMDSPPFGGFTAAFPMRIGLEVSLPHLTPKTLLMHEFTHYMQAATKTSGWLGRLAAPLSPDLQRMYTLSSSDISLEGSTSFIDGNRRSEYSSLPIRAAVLEGQMWNYDQIATGALRKPGSLRVYLSGMLIQDWLFDTCGDDALIRILNEKDKTFFALEKPAFKKYTGLDIQVAWGDICARLEKRYTFARELPQGRACTPRDSDTEPQWYTLKPSAKGFLQYRSSLKDVASLGFWRPLEKQKIKNKEKPHGLLENDSGTFIPLEGLVSGDFSVSADSGFVAAILNEPADTALYHDTNSNRLVLARVQWCDGDHQARATDFRLLPGSGFASPCLSPDGKRLFATRRIADLYYAVEYDLTEENLRVLNIPPSLSINNLEISPDGLRLAVGFLKSGQYDVGIYDLSEESFTILTNDEAMDFAPRFLLDGTYVFSSDRENTIAIYRFQEGVFSRECIEQVAAFSPVEDGRGGYYYSTYSAFGRVIRHLDSSELQKEPLPQFTEWLPGWIERRDLIWKTYRDKGVPLAAQWQGEAEPKQKAAPAARRFWDIPRPRAWSPLVSAGAEGWGFGASIEGYSFLGENTYSASLRYQPESRQVSAAAALMLRLTFMSADINLSQNYYGTTLANEAINFTLLRKYALGAGIPLGLWKSPGGNLKSLTALANVSLSERLGSLEPFSLPDSFSLTPARNLILSSGLEGRISWPAPASALFGGSYLNSRLEGLMEWENLPNAPQYGSSANLGLGFLYKANLFKMGAKGAWRGAGSAHELIPRTVARWEQDSASPLYAEAALQWSLSSLDKEITEQMLLIEQSGLTFTVKSFWEAESLSAPRWLSELEFSCDFAANIVLYYSPLFLQYGFSYRYFVDPGGEHLFDPDNLCFRINFNGVSLSL